MSTFLNKPRTVGQIACPRTKEEQAAVIYTDRNRYDWLFWHLQMSRFAAIDAGDTESLWVISLNRALAALQQKDFGELERICTDIDTNFNGGCAQKKEAEAIANAYAVARR